MSLPEHLKAPGAADSLRPMFQLQPTEVPQPTLLDEEIATHDWPLPKVKPWPKQPQPSLLRQIWRALARGAS